MHMKIYLFIAAVAIILGIILTPQCASAKIVLASPPAVMTPQKHRVHTQTEATSTQMTKKEVKAEIKRLKLLIKSLEEQL